MKTILILNNKIFIIISLSMFLMILISCQKNREIFEIENRSNDLLLEEISCNNTENINDLYKKESEFLPTIIKPIPLSFDDSYNMTLLYKYDGYWSMNFDDYYRLDDRNTDDKNINNTEWEGTGFIPEGPNNTK